MGLRGTRLQRSGENYIMRSLRKKIGQVFKNRGIREIFGPKRDEVTEEWRKLHNEHLKEEEWQSVQE